MSRRMAAGTRRDVKHSGGIILLTVYGQGGKLCPDRTVLARPIALHPGAPASLPNRETGIIPSCEGTSEIYLSNWPTQPELPQDSADSAQLDIMVNHIT